MSEKIKDISEENMSQVSIGQEHKMRVIAQMLEHMLGKGVGFTLLVFPINSTGRMSYISNAKRKDMMTALRDAVAQLDCNQDIPASSDGVKH